MVLGKLDIHMQKNETGPFSYTIHKDKLKMDERSKCETRFHKNPREEHTHFEFIFVYDVREWSSFIFLHVAVQFSQHHLLKRLKIFPLTLPSLCCQLGTKYSPRKEIGT